MTSCDPSTPLPACIIGFSHDWVTSAYAMLPAVGPVVPPTRTLRTVSASVTLSRWVPPQQGVPRLCAGPSPKETAAPARCPTYRNATPVVYPVVPSRGVLTVALS